MRFHKDGDKRTHPLRPLPIDAPPPLRTGLAVRQLGALVSGPFKRRSLRPESPRQEDGIAEDSPMIGACYEAYLSLQGMLAVFAELRGDGPDPL